MLPKAVCSRHHVLRAAADCRHLRCFYVFCCNSPQSRRKSLSEALSFSYETGANDKSNLFSAWQKSFQHEHYHNNCLCAPLIAEARFCKKEASYNRGTCLPFCEMLVNFRNESADGCAEVLLWGKVPLTTDVFGSHTHMIIIKNIP